MRRIPADLEEHAVRLAALLVLTVLAWYGYEWYGAQRAETQCKENCLTIQRALESYGAARRAYPEHLQALVDAGFLTSMPRNPYCTARSGARLPARMEEQPAGQHEAGGVGYAATGSGPRATYLLVVYGDERAFNAHRTLSGSSLSLGPGLTTLARQIEWEHALLLLQARGWLGGE